MQATLNNLFPGEFPEVPEGGAIWVFRARVSVRKVKGQRSKVKGKDKGQRRIMLRLIRTVVPAFVAGVAGAWLAIAAWPVTTDAQGYRPPRLADGHPDLNGIWQALNEANYDIQLHVARPRRSRCADGPYGPVQHAGRRTRCGWCRTAGVGIVDGDELPYKPDALKTKQENQQQWLSRDPEIKCYLPGVPRATYMPYPFQIVQSASQLLISVRICGRRPRHSPEGSGPAPCRFVDGSVGGEVGRRHARRRCHRAQRSDLVRSRRQLP
jgi:hypothetical protein